MMLDKRLGNALVMVLTLVLAGCASSPSPKPDTSAFNPQAAAIHAQQGRQAWERGERERALGEWRQAVSLNPADATTVNNLALALMEDHQFGKAAEFLQRGLEHSPDVAALHYNLAVICELYLLDLDRALSHYRRYHELTASKDTKVAGWIKDLERRVN